MKNRRQGLALFPCLALCGVMTSACEKIEAWQPVAPRSCQAQIVFVGSAKACPATRLKFRIAVVGCRLSSGTFAYDYKLVDEAHKETVSASGNWAGRSGAWEQTESVAHRCDEEIDDVDSARVSVCNCSH